MSNIPQCPAALAIVIPAWKAAFFAQALDSIAQQTGGDFHVYIGDDAGAPELAGLVEKHLSTIPHTYYRFESNLGRTDLVAHWNRCLELTRGEEWIWLFSDDDIMDRGCVEAFHQARQQSTTDLFHFGLATIDESGKVQRTQSPDFASIEDYVRRRMRDEIASSAVEWIFRRTALEEVGGFQKFDLAWGSDDATWIKLGRRARPMLIDGPLVSWRLSSQSISPDQSRGTTVRKTRARLEFLKWLRHEQYSAATDPLAKREYFAWFAMTIRTEIVPLTVLGAIGALWRFNRSVALVPFASMALLPNLALTRAIRVSRSLLKQGTPR